MPGKNSLKPALAALGVVLAGLLVTVPAASAADTLFWIDLENEEIKSMQLNGSSPPTALSTAPAGVVADQQSEGAGSLDYDPETGRLYWPNAGLPGNISWAAADGTGGGQLNVTGNPVQPTSGLSLDGANDLLYLVGGVGESVATMGLDGTQGTWALNDDNFRGGPLADAQGGTLWLAGPEWISYGNLDGSGSLGTYSPAAFMGGGFSVDRDADRLYGTWYPGPGNADVLGWINTDASGDGSLAPTAVDVFGASSTAIDHDTGDIYWTNAYPFGEQADTRGIFRMPLAGGAGEKVGEFGIGGRSGGLIILKTPQTTSEPVLSGGTTVGSTLSCSDVTWAGDRPEAHYFRSPVLTRLIWTYNGSWIEEAIDQETITADRPGAYQCVRSGANAAGIGFAMSNEIEVPEEPPVCPAIFLGVQASKFSPSRPFGTVNAPGVRVTLKTRVGLVVSMQPTITFNGRNGPRVGKLRKHQITVNGRKRLRFLLPGKLIRAIAKQRGEVRFAPVTFAASATVWRPGNRQCAQGPRDLKLKTRVYFVSKKPGIGLRRLR